MDGFKALMDSYLQAPTFTFCGMDTWTSTVQYDLTVLGIACGVGAVGNTSGVAGAPAMLRSASRLFPVEKDEPGETIGWFDYTQNRAILSGRKLADAGNLRIDRYHPVDALGNLPKVLNMLLRNSKMVLLLGGDHSMTYWTTKDISPQCALTILDAHEDATARTSELPHGGNVVTFLEDEPGVQVILQYGLRGLVPNQRRSPVAKRHLCQTIDELSHAIGECDARYSMISIDVDVLDPSIMRSVESPSPNGITSAELLKAVSAAAALPVRVMEIVEFSPTKEASPLEAMALVQIMLRAADACLEGR